ncbi:unnamed protein product [Rhodiola kirilowii]
MFYSQCLLSRKGPLGAVLVAAYCHSRLKKAQVITTDIPSSVTKIIEDGFQAFTYRILGYLLLGVVRIYSCKVDYVLLDCNQMHLKAKQLLAVKQKEVQESSMIALNRSITLPESLELDKFLFEDTGVERREHVLPEEEIMLKDLWANVATLKFSPNENQLRGEGGFIDLETFSDSGAPNDDISSPHSVDMSFDDNLMCGMDIERSIETLIQKLASPLEACEAEMSDLPGHDSSFPVMSTEITDENEAQNLKEVDSSKGQIEHANKLFATVEISPEKNPSDPSDGDEQITVLPTPVIIENVPVNKKRKYLFDEQVLLNNKKVKESISYSRDLVRKRGIVPKTVLGAWKQELFSNLKKNSTRPLIRCAFLDSNSGHYDEKLISAESPLNLGASEVLKIPVSTDDKINEKENIEEPMVPVAVIGAEHTAIAPQTPFRGARLQEFPMGEDFERVREASSSNSTDEELDMDHHEELPIEVNNSFLSETDSKEPDGWSASTRQAVKDLSSAFSAKIGPQEMEHVNLQETLKGESKTKSAKLFYDLLVLKSRGMVNVQQHKPYGDIQVSKSADWEDNN